MNTRINHNQADRVFKWLDRFNALLLTSLVVILFLSGCSSKTEVKDEAKVDAGAEVTAEEVPGASYQGDYSASGQVNILAGSSIKSEVTDNLGKRYNRLVYAYEQLSLALEINK